MNLETRYLGLKLKHPVVPSASPLSSTVDGVRRLEDAGAPAVVLYSLFEEHIRKENRFLDRYLSYGFDSREEAMLTLPDTADEDGSIEDYLSLVADAKRAVAIPIIASLNGTSPGEWTRYARELARAGADALEINLYSLPADLERTAAEVEQTCLNVLRDVKEDLNIPVAVKLSPYFSSPGNFALRLARAGADGLVLFNRSYEPDFDIETRQAKLELVLSNSHEMRLPLRWVALLYGRVPADLAITGGVHGPEDVVRALMAGASVAMTASALLQHGPQRLGEMVAGLARWLEAHDYEAASDLQGVMSLLELGRRSDQGRSGYIRMLRKADRQASDRDPSTRT